MADNLVVKLGADTSEFRGQIAGAAGAFKQAFGSDSGSKIGDEFSRAFNRKIGVSDVARAALVSLGIDAKAIAESVARAWAGVSKEEEAAYKTIGELSGRVADAEIAQARKRLNAQQLYQALLLDEQRLVKSMVDNAGKTAVDQLRLLNDRNKLIEVRNQLESAGIAAIEEENKRLNAMFKDLDLINAAKAKWAEEDRQRLEKIAKEDEDYYKKSARLDAELRRQKEEGLSTEQKIKAYEEDIKELKRQQAAYDKSDNEYKERQIKINEINKNIETERLNIAKEQAKQTQKTVDILAGGVGGDTGVIKSLSGFSTYNDPSQQRTYEKQLLAQARSEIQDQIDELQGKINAYLRSGSSLGGYEIPALQERLKTLEYRKQNVDQYVFNPNYSDKAGQGIFASQVTTIGDPLGLQKKSVDTLDKVAQGILDINNRLRVAGFGTGG